MFVLDSLYLNYCVVLGLPLTLTMCSICTVYRAEIFFSLHRSYKRRENSPKNVSHVHVKAYASRALYNSISIVFSDSNLPIKPVGRERPKMYYCVCVCRLFSTNANTLCRLFLVVNVRCRCFVACVVR